jgi:hypothetical protein
MADLSVPITDSPQCQRLATGSEIALRWRTGDICFLHEVCDTRFMAAQAKTVEE